MTFEEAVAANPKMILALISIVITFFSTLAHKWLTNQEHLKSLKDRQKELQKEMKENKDPTFLQEAQSELMKITGAMLKSSMRPLIVTILPFLILFTWLRTIYTPIMGSSWIWYYIGFSVVASMIIRKVLKVS